MACGHEALLFYALLRGSDYDSKKGVRHVGLKSSWTILLHLHPTVGRASYWRPSLLVQAVAEAGIPAARKLLDEVGARDELEQQFTQVLASFQHQIVWTKTALGIAGGLSGAPLETLAEGKPACSPSPPA